MTNLTIYNKIARPPKDALKTIQAGRLKGKSDINPQWRIKAMTEQFGVVGIGWYPVIKKLWSEPGAGGVIFCFAEVDLYVKIDGEWSQAIPGTGGHQLVESESKGMHNNDEGYKMAVTDALSTSMKLIGMAADIYAGLWDGSKYKDDPKPEQSGKPTKESLAPNHPKWNDAKKALQSQNVTLETLKKHFTISATNEKNLTTNETV